MASNGAPSEDEENTMIKMSDIPREDRWKFGAPYKAHSSEGFNAIYKGSCHCGNVKYELSREAPLVSKYCHCTDCQVQHGALFQWAAIFHKTDINFTSGYHGLSWYDSSSKKMEHKLPCKVRCAHCHTPIMDEGRNMILLFPTLLNLDTQEKKDKFKPECHMFYPRRRIDINDGLPKWTGLDKSSDLIADSPPEMVEELKNKRKQEKEEEVNGEKK